MAQTTSRARSLRLSEKPNRRQSTRSQHVYPVFLNLQNVPVLVVGGGLVAVRKLESVLSAGARVTLVAPEVHPSLKKHTRSLKLQRRAFRSSDLKGKRLVFAATNHPKLNAQIARQAKRQGIFVNVVSPPEAGDVQIPGSIKHGSFCVAVSTGGASPMLARLWREKLEKMIGPEWGEWTGLLEQSRKRILAEIHDEVTRLRLFQRLGHMRWAKLVKRRGLTHARREVNKLIRRFK